MILHSFLRYNDRAQRTQELLIAAWIPFSVVLFLQKSGRRGGKAVAFSLDFFLGLA